MTYQQEDYDPETIIRTLVDNGVQFVVLGGTAAAIRGGDIPTVDTDISPSRDADNLTRLAAALAQLGSKLRTPEGELVDAPLDEAALRNYTTCATRTAQAGDLDLVFDPDGVAGGYQTLVQDADVVTIGGRPVLIASVSHIHRSRDAAYRKTGLAKYARGEAALTLAVDVTAEVRAGGIQLEPLRSRALESVGYDPAARTLRVRFRHGGLYDYLDVPPEVFDSLRESPHPWTTWGQHIKQTYECSAVDL